MPRQPANTAREREKACAFRTSRHIPISGRTLSRVGAQCKVCFSRGLFFSRSWPSEKFLIEPSREFLLTAVRQKDGINCDEPRGTRLAGLVKRAKDAKMTHREAA